MAGDDFQRALFYKGRPSLSQSWEVSCSLIAGGQR